MRLAALLWFLAAASPAADFVLIRGGPMPGNPEVRVDDFECQRPSKKENDSAFVRQLSLIGLAVVNTQRKDWKRRRRIRRFPYCFDVSSGTSSTFRNRICS
jgi:hypothetical protein